MDRPEIKPQSRYRAIKFISQSHLRHSQSHVRATGGPVAGQCCEIATFMALWWDCGPPKIHFTVPPRGHYSSYQVGLLCAPALFPRPSRVKLAEHHARQSLPTPIVERRAPFGRARVMQVQASPSASHTMRQLGVDSGRARDARSSTGWPSRPICQPSTEHEPKQKGTVQRTAKSAGLRAPISDHIKNF